MLVTPGKAVAQTYNGHVADKADGQPISGVIVTALDGNGKIIKYTTTSKNGDFNLTISKAEKLEFSMMGYKKVSVKATTGKLIILMNIESTNLKEVYVKAPKLTLRGDTLIYNVASYAEAQDKNIGDVLKKMPGIGIKKTGEIYYNGEPINKFYIDGNDMISDRYGLATNNLKPEDVQKVEVLEHHQPIKSLQNKVFSDRAAINLKLKESVKTKWTGNLSGAGGDALWNGNIFLMRIGGKNQMMFSAKTDNTGRDFSSDLETFTTEDYEINGSKDYNATVYFSVGTTAAPLESRRTRFNHSALASIDNSKKINENYTFNTHIDYYYDRLTSLYTGNTKYFFKDSSITDNNFEAAKEYMHKADVKLNLKANTAKFYMYEGLKAGLVWQTATNYMTGSYPNRQNAWTPLDNFQNNLKYIRNAGDSKTITIASMVKYMTQNQNLEVNRDTIFTNSSPAASDTIMQRQTINAKVLYTNNTIGFGGKIGEVDYDLSCGAEALRKSLKTELSGTKDTTLQTLNNLTIGYVGGYARPTFTYKNSSIKIELGVPAGIYYTYIHQLNKRFRNKNTGTLTYKPNINFKWYVTGKLTFTVSGSIEQDAVNVDNLYTGGIMSSYRDISYGTNDFAQSKAKQISAHINYKNPMDGLFFDFGASESWNTNPYISSQYFEGEYIINSYKMSSHSTTGNYLFGSITKNIDMLGGPIKLDMSYSRFNYDLIQSISSSKATKNTEEKVKYISNTLSVNPHCTFHFSTWLNTEYSLNYQHSTLKFADQKTTSHNSYDQRLDLNFVAGKKVTFQIVTEHYHTELGIVSADKKRTKDVLMQDFLLQWKINNSLNINLFTYNLFNKKEYAYTVFSGSSSVSSSYRIRPRNILLGFQWNL